jgi:hypothetical protein
MLYKSIHTPPLLFTPQYSSKYFRGESRGLGCLSEMVLRGYAGSYWTGHTHASSFTHWMGEYFWVCLNWTLLYLLAAFRLSLLIYPLLLSYGSRYIPYPGGGEKWGGNGVGDDLYSYGFDGAYLWTGELEELWSSPNIKCHSNRVKGRKVEMTGLPLFTWENTR